MRTQLSRVQFVFLSMWLILGTAILVLPFTIAHFVVRDAWITPFLFGLGGMVVVGVIALFVRTFPSQTLIEGCHTAFGPVLGRIASSWLLYLIFILECFVLREASLFLNITVLPMTPVYIVTGLFMIPVAYAVYQGLEAIGRMTEIITPIGFGITLMLSLLALQHADLSHIKPVLADGWKPILQGGVAVWMFAWELLLVLQLREPVQQHRLVKDLLITVLIIVITGITAELTVPLVLGPTIAYTAYPILEVVRTIRLGEFLERLDPLYVMGVVTTIFLKLSFMHYTLATGIGQWFSLKHYRPAVWSGGALVWAGSLFFIHDGAVVMDFILYTAWGYLTFTGTVIPLLATAVQYWRRRKSPQTR